MNSSQDGSTHARSSEPLPLLSVYAILAGIQIAKTTLREYGGGNNGRLIDWSFGDDIRNRQHDCGLLLTRTVLFDAVELLPRDHPVAQIIEERPAFSVRQRLDLAKPISLPLRMI
jgi:hypothetical protein